MKSKSIRSIALLSVICLTGCDASSSSSLDSSSAEDSSSVISSSEDSSTAVSSSEETTSASSYSADDITIDTVISSLEEALEQSVSYYDYEFRSYMQYTQDEEPTSNESTVRSASYYEDGSAELIVKNYNPSKVSDITAETAYSSYNYSFYEADDKHFLLACTDVDDPENSYVRYYEKTPWMSTIQDFVAAGIADAHYYLNSLLTTFSDPDNSIDWSFEEFTQKGFIVEEQDDGFLCSYRAIDEDVDDTGVYGNYVSSANVILSKDDLSVNSVYYSAIKYFEGYEVGEEDEGAGYVYAYGIDNIIYGDGLEGSATETDLSSLSSSQIRGAVPSSAEIVELEDGNLSENDVVKIFENIDAYTEDTIQTSYIEDLQIYDDDYNVVGWRKRNGSTNLYADYIYIKSYSIVAESDEYSSLNGSTYIQYTAGETGIDVITIDYDTEGGITDTDLYTISSSSIGSIYDYYTASISYVSGYFYLLSSDIADYGFGDTVHSYGTDSYVLNSAVKSGDEITINITYNYTSSDDSSTNSHTYTITIEDNFVTKFLDEYGEHYSEYTMVQGELPEFTGTLVTL